MSIPPVSLLGSSTDSPSPTNSTDEAGFKTALANASGPSPYSYFDLVPPDPTIGVGVLPVSPIVTLPSGSVPAKPGSIPIGSITLHPTSTNAQNSSEPEEPDDAPQDTPPEGSSPAAQAAFYAERANDYAQAANLTYEEAQDAYNEVADKAAVASPEDRAKADQAVALAKQGLDQSSAAAKAANYAAFDASADAAAAAAAEDNDDIPQAIAEAAAARGSMLGAKTEYTAADTGVGKIIEADDMLNPDFPYGQG